MRPVLSLMELCSKLHYLPEKLFQTEEKPSFEKEKLRLRKSFVCFLEK